MYPTAFALRADWFCRRREQRCPLGPRGRRVSGGGRLARSLPGDRCRPLEGGRSQRPRTRSAHRRRPPAGKQPREQRRSSGLNEPAQRAPHAPSVPPCRTRLEARRMRGPRPSPFRYSATDQPTSRTTSASPKRRLRAAPSSDKDAVRGRGGRHRPPRGSIMPRNNAVNLVRCRPPPAPRTGVVNNGSVDSPPRYPSARLMASRLWPTTYAMAGQQAPAVGMSPSFLKARPTAACTSSASVS